MFIHSNIHATFFLFLSHFICSFTLNWNINSKNISSHTKIIIYVRWYFEIFSIISLVFLAESLVNNNILGILIMLLNLT